MSTTAWQTHKQRVRLAFLNAAIQLIIEKGYDAVNVTAIAERADYGRSTFYLYFRDKEELVWSLLESYMRVTDQRIQEAIVGLESPEREWRAWQIIFAEAEVQRPFFLSLDGELSRRLRQVQKDYLVAVFTEQLRAGVFSLLVDVPPEITARFITGAILDVLEFWMQTPEIGDAPQMAAYFFQLVFRQPPPDLPNIPPQIHPLG